MILFYYFSSFVYSGDKHFALLNIGENKLGAILIVGTVACNLLSFMQNIDMVSTCDRTF